MTIVNRERLAADLRSELEEWKEKAGTALAMPVRFIPAEVLAEIDCDECEQKPVQYAYEAPDQSASANIWRCIGCVWCVHPGGWPLVRLVATE